MALTGYVSAMAGVSVGGFCFGFAAGCLMVSENAKESATAKK